MVFMSNTRDKLNEARYFLKLMTENQNERESFRYALSAFLAAARSVTLFMQREYKRIPGFNDWYEKQREWMKKNKTMKVLKGKRDVSIHCEPLTPRAHVNMTVSDGVTLSESVSLVVVKYDSQGKEITRIETKEPSKEPSKQPPEPEPPTVEWRWYFDEIPGADLLTVCTDYVAELEQLVSECETRFGDMTI